MILTWETHSKYVKHHIAMVKIVQVNKDRTHKTNQQTDFKYILTTTNQLQMLTAFVGLP